ncbi:MAG: PIN domain-containing protein [Burkholderiaceae bacterium]|nr:PIN domain-containing protein [Burkholderiaceae bacterium]
MTLRALLDVNVLVALLDGSHVHHRTATDWLAAHARLGWASCPLTQHGCLRILSLPSYPNPQPTASVAQRLGRAVADASHAFWPDGFSLLEAGRIHWNRVLSSRQITDAYLLALAAAHGGRLVTFDRGIAVEAVRGAGPENLLTLS